MTDPFASAAVVERVPRVVYRVTGERPLAYLHDVLAQDVIDLREGTGAIAALLTAEGRIAAEVRVLPLEKDVLFDAEPAARDGIEAYIARHSGLAGCEVVEASEDMVVAAVRGQRIIAGMPPNEEAAFHPSGDAYVVRVVWGLPGLDVLGPPSEVNEVIRNFDLPRATLEELDAARIAAGRPVFGRDFDASTLVNETPLLTRGVSLTKGCYPGQESVARVHNLGRIRRVLRGLTADAPLDPGTELTAGGTVVGTITSAARSPDGGFAAIALVRSEVEPGATIGAGDAAAVVEALP